ncbi:MAG: ABC transporter six-transmembrane domain-containing protein [Pseudomonadota bacterium]
MIGQKSAYLQDSQLLLSGERLSVGALFKTFPGSIGITWMLTLLETVLIAFAPLFIGFAIDGLLKNDLTALMYLSVLLGTLIGVGVVRRIFDTRAYGMIRVELGRELVSRAGGHPVSATNARLDMARELADFLEDEVPDLLGSFVHLCVALVILLSFHPVLFGAALSAGILVLLIYAAVHRRFFRLNGRFNHQMERQVTALSSGSLKKLRIHLLKLRKAEIRISDTEAFVYGAMFAVLIGFIIFNLWFAATNLDMTPGRIFSIVSYSWEFVEAALVLPATLQSWSRLSEITERINAAG